MLRVLQCWCNVNELFQFRGGEYRVDPGSESGNHVVPPGAAAGGMKAEDAAEAGGIHIRYAAQLNDGFGLGVMTDCFLEIEEGGKRQRALQAQDLNARTFIRRSFDKKGTIAHETSILLR